MALVDIRWQQVKCIDCGKEYQCTPNQDYFHLAGFPPEDKSTENGYCWDCFMKAAGMKSQAEPPYLP